MWIQVAVLTLTTSTKTFKGRTSKRPLDGKRTPKNGFGFWRFSGRHRKRSDTSGNKQATRLNDASSDEASHNRARIVLISRVVVVVGVSLPLPLVTMANPADVPPEQSKASVAAADKKPMSTLVSARVWEIYSPPPMNSFKVSRDFFSIETHYNECLENE